MAHLAFEPFPTAEPRPAPPEDYQRIQTNPREFGSQVGAGLEHLGAGVTEVGHLYGQIAADDQVNHVISGLDDLQSKMLSLRGKDAMDQQAGVRQQMRDLMDQARGNLSTADQVLQFNNQTRFLYSRADRTVVDHADQQTKVWGAEVNKSAQELAFNGAAQAAAAGDMASAEAHTQDAIRAGVRNAHLQFGEDLPVDSEIIQNAAREARAQSLRLQTTAMIPANPTGAQQLLDQNAQYFNPLEYEALSQRLKGAQSELQAQQFVYGLPAQPPSVAPPGQPGQSLASLVAAGGTGALTDHLIQREGGSPHGVANNPGNIKFTGAPGQTDSGVHATDGGTFASYATPQDGRQAVANLIAHAASGQSPAYGAAPTVSGFINTYEGHGHVPGLESALSQIYGSNLSSQAKDRAARLARENFTASWTDQERARTARDQAQKDLSDAAENRIIADAASDNPKITARDIANMPELTPEAKLRMMAAIRGKAAGPNAQATAAYGAGFWPLYQRVAAPQGGQLAPLLDQGEIMRHVGPGGDLTLAGAQELTKTMAAMRRPEQAGDTKLQAGALSYAKHHISFSYDDGFTKYRDPVGEDRFNVGFLPAFMQYWQRGTQAGKTPQELVDKKALDQLMQPFMGSDAERMQRQLAAGTEGQSSASAQHGPPPAAVAYLRAHPDLRPAFDEKYGAGTATGILGPSVPIAH